MAIDRLPSPGAGIPTSTVTAKGDLIAGTANNAVSRLAVGANGTTLVADSAEATGLKWASASSSITSANAAVNAEESTTSTSFGNLTTSGPTVTLTTGTKVLVIVSTYAYGSAAGSAAVMGYDISGATTYSAGFDEVNQIWNNGAGSSVGLQNSWVSYKTVTAGSNTFTAKYRLRGSGTATFDKRQISVINLGS